MFWNIRPIEGGWQAATDGVRATVEGGRTVMRVPVRLGGGEVARRLVCTLGDVRVYVDRDLDGALHIFVTERDLY